MRVGVLALQGAFREHLLALKLLGHVGVEVRESYQLEGLDALIIPGGESTAMRKLIDKGSLLGPLREFAACKPTLGTCAGAILLAAHIEGSEVQHIGALDIVISRNAYGSQLDSFVHQGRVGGLTDVPMVFIRAPIIRAVGENVEVLARVREDIVAVRQGHVWALTFHPELTRDLRVHEQFLKQE